MTRLRSFLQSRAAVRLGLDVLALVGLVLVGVGLWAIWPPVALIAVGSLLLAGAVFAAWSGR